MNARRTIPVLLLGLMASPVLGQTAGMLSFQGLIKDNMGNPVTGTVDLEFRIFDAETLGSQVDMNGDGIVDALDTTVVLGVSVTDGILSTKFGPVHPKAFDGTQRWLEVSVDDGGGGGFVPLSRIEMATAPATAEQVNRPGSGTEAIHVADNGNVTLGIRSSVYKLSFGPAANNNILALADEVIGQFRGLGAIHGGGVFGIGFWANLGANFTPDMTNTSMFISANNANVGIGTTDPQEKLHVAGTTRTNILVAGTTTTNILTITGGADLAEPFAVAKPLDKGGKIERGMVVVIDRENPGRLKVATEPYDAKVAGIISGANGLKPGMVMKAEGAALLDPAVSQRGRNADPGADISIRTGSASPGSSTGGEAGATSKQNVALTGRVWCWCDASFGAIHPGDRLTTSSTPGHAMKVTDNIRAIGTVIGKAMTPLKDGRGLVLVLVQPQ